MAADPDDETVFVALAVAAAPALTSEVIADLRRVFKTGQLAPVAKLPGKTAEPTRRAA